MRSFILLALMLVLSQLSAQSPQPSKIPLKGVETVIMPSLDNEELRNEELHRRGPGIAPRFAHNFPVDITPQSHGTWTELSQGEAIWRLKIQSKGAYSLNLGFVHYFMPEGGSMLLYDPKQKQVRGPFTLSDNEDHAQFWSPLVEGDELIIEVRLPVSQKSKLGLHLSSVNHDFIGFAQALSASGSCNLDVICGATDGWAMVDEYRDIIRSVAVYGLGGGTLCTGFLVNNTANDCTPLFMTANHCGLTPGNAPSVVVYWNFQNSTCRQPNSGASGGNGDGTLSQFNSGAIYRAGWAGSDFTLIELDDEVDPDYEPFMAGWNASNSATGDSVICVHHPSTDEKRISFEFDPTFIGDDSGNADPNDNFVVVDDWDVGTTEGGSSGAPLFNKQKQVIGQLFGGFAACGNNQYDAYGWIHRSWEGGGTPGTRLRDWLDPGNTGQTSLQGRDCGIGVNTSTKEIRVCKPGAANWGLEVLSSFTNPVQLTIVGLPAQSYTLTNNPVTPGGNTNLIVLTAGLPAGTYPFTVKSNDGIDSSDLALVLQVDDGAPLVTNLTSPADMAIQQPTQASLRWQTNSFESYHVQLSLDGTFNSLVFEDSSLTQGEILVPQVLLEETAYFWRVRAKNSCGTGPWSPGYSFQTGARFCGTNPALSVPIGISSGPPNTITSTIQISETGVIGEVKVSQLAITHSWIEDLTVTLTSPQGTSVVLMGDLNCNLSDAFLNFDDQGLASSVLQVTCSSVPPALIGTFQPIDPFANFIGENPQGTWTLTVEDGAFQDGGSLDGWDLEICTLIPSALTIDPQQATLCAEDTFTFDLQFGEAFNNGNGQVLILSASNLPVGAQAAFSPNPAQANGFSQGQIWGISGGATHQIDIIAQNGTITLDRPLVLSSGELQEVDLLFPLNGSDPESVIPVLNWTRANADSQVVQLAQDGLFSPLIRQASFIADSSWTPDSLDFLTQYFWRVISFSDCGSDTSETFSFTTDRNTSVTSLSTGRLTLAPNPARTELVIETPLPLEKSSLVQVFDPAGREVLRKAWPLGSNRFRLLVEELPAGVYVMRVGNEGGFWREKFMIQD